MADHSTLLTVSGVIPPDLDEQVALGRRPRADYRVLADTMSSDVVDVDTALARTGRLGRILGRVGGAPLLLGWYCFKARRRYDVIVTDGEQVGLPFAVLCRLFGRGAARHVMIVHILSVPKKQHLMKWARLTKMIDRYVVYCSRQRDFIIDELGAPADRVVLSTFMVDSEFFSPDAVTVPAPERRMICSAGLERRDYPTLMEAIVDLDVDVVIAAASPWSKQHDSSTDRPLPGNVEVRRLNLFELRELYAASAFVVMPLLEVEFQAGITTILEAMAMGRAVVCTRTHGQTDTIIDGETGLYVPPSDAASLRTSIEALLSDRDEAARLGANARSWVVAQADIVRYAEALAQVVSGLRE